VWYQHQLHGLSHNWRVISLDMRGHGELSTLDNGYCVSRLAADLCAMIEAYDFPDVDLMGHSIGPSAIWSYYDLYDNYRLGRMVFADQAPSVSAKLDWLVEDIVIHGCVLPDLPTLVVGAEASIFFAESKVWAADHIPDVEVEIFSTDKDAAHFMCYENPTKFNALVGAFLS